MTPVRGVCLTSDDQGLGLKSWLTGPRREKGKPEESARPISSDKYRVAVLPFANMSPDSSDEYFADGMTEELIMTMSKIEQFEVISRTSVMQFKKNPKPIKEVSRELDAGTILEGSIRKSGNNLRVTVQMIDPAKDRHVWAESYDRQLKDAFSIQTEISKAVAEELKIRLLPTDKARLEKKPTGSPEAYTLYLKGKYYLNERTKDGFQKAIQYFTEATNRDPSFARAYVGLSSCYGIMENWGYVKTEEAIGRIRVYAAKALELDDSLGEAHVELANLLASREWKIPEAEREYKRALELDPNYSRGHQQYAFTILGPQGRHQEALSQLKEALRLDPLSHMVAANIGDEYLLSGNYQDAESQYRRVLETAPNFPYAHARLGIALLRESRYEEAISEMLKSQKYTDDQNMSKVDLILGYWTVGRTDDAENLLKELEQKFREEYFSNVFLALANAAAGKRDRAIELLEKAVSERSNQLRSNMGEPHFDEMRSDPRFQNILRTIGMKQPK